MKITHPYPAEPTTNDSGKTEKYACLQNATNSTRKSTPLTDWRRRQLNHGTTCSIMFPSRRGSRKVLFSVSKRPGSDSQPAGVSKKCLLLLLVFAPIPRPTPNYTHVYLPTYQQNNGWKWQRSLFRHSGLTVEGHKWSALQAWGFQTFRSGWCYPPDRDETFVGLW